MKLLLGLLLMPAVLVAQGPRAGVGAVKLTPGEGTAMAGYFSYRGSTGVHDDLWARALVLESGGRRAALVACDVIHIPDAVAEAARGLIERSTGLKPNEVMISATHAHTGPEMVGAVAETVAARIAESVRLALGGMREARLRVGEGREPTLVFIRRFLMADGTIGWNPGKLNPRILRPVGEPDARVGVVRVDAGGEPLAVWVNYGLHLDTVGGTEISADYPYTMRTLVERAVGGMALFTLGTAGNVNHIDVSSGARQGGHAEAARIGTVLAGEVIKTQARLEEAGEGPLRALRGRVELATAGHSREEAEWARGVAKLYGKPGAAPFLEMVKAMRIEAVEALGGRPMGAEVQVIAWGADVAWVGLPGEVFVELGEAIRKASPFRHTMVVSLANGHLGYVPHEKAWDEGNYEVVTARVARGGGERLVAEAIRLLKEAKEWK